MTLQVFPYNNPAETYKYYSLPFCRPKISERERQRFGEMLVGDRKASRPSFVSEPMLVLMALVWAYRVLLFLLLLMSCSYFHNPVKFHSEITSSLLFFSVFLVAHDVRYFSSASNVKSFV